MRRTFSSSTDFSKTFQFIVPLLKLPTNLIQTYCINAFSWDWNNPDLINHIFLLFEYVDDPVQQDLDRKIKTNKNFHSSYHPSSSYIIYIFNNPPEYEEDINQFRNSKYSKIRDDTKRFIVKYWPNISQTSKLYGTLFRTDRRKKELEEMWSEGSSYVPLPPEAEYASLLNEQQETFSVEHLVKL